MRHDEWVGMHHSQVEEADGPLHVHEARLLDPHCFHLAERRRLPLNGNIS